MRVAIVWNFVFVCISGLMMSCASIQDESETLDMEPILENSASSTDPLDERLHAEDGETRLPETICSRGEDRRVIQVVHPKNKGCVVEYEKFGNRKEVAKAAVNLNYCDDASGRIRNNLAKAGFACEKVNVIR